MRAPALLSPLLLAGCLASAPAPAPTPPDLALRLEHWYGTSLGGPYPASGPFAVASQGAEGSETVDEPPSETVDAWGLWIETLWSPRTPGELIDGADLSPLAPVTSLVAAVGRAMPFLPAPILAERVRVVALDPAAPDRAAWLERVRAEGQTYDELRGLLVTKHTASLGLRLPGRASQRAQLAVEVERAADVARLVVVVVGDPAQTIELPEVGAGAAVVDELALDFDVEQRAVLDLELVPGGASQAVIFPSPFDGGRSSLVIAVRLAGDPGANLALLPAIAEQVREAGDGVARAPEDARRVALSTAIDAVDGDARRLAVGFLAREVQAETAYDLALLADDEQLDQLAAEAVQNVVLVGDGAITALAWELERAALTLLATEQRDSTLGPALESVLLRHTGEVGRLPSTLLDLLASAGSVEALYASLLFENRILLNDPDPGARRRAHRWLSSRGAAVPGYDPFAPDKERRAALMEAEQANAAPAGDGSEAQP